jgi:hypothetical protein
LKPFARVTEYTVARVWNAQNFLQMAKQQIQAAIRLIARAYRGDVLDSLSLSRMVVGPGWKTIG